MSKRHSAGKAVPIGHRPRSRGHTPNWPAVAKAHLDVDEVTGDGPHALVSWCPPTTTVHLYPSETSASSSREVIDALACGHACRGSGHHEVIDLAALVARVD